MLFFRQLTTGFEAFIFTIIAVNGFAATIHNPCYDVSLLSITDRGSVTNTPCVMPSKTVMLESGYQLKQYAHAGSQQIFSEPKLLIGLPADTEFEVVLPTYNQLSTWPFSGFSATQVGAKHEVAYGRNWVASVETLLTPPGGSTGFGSQGFGVLVDSMVSYSINSKNSLAFMLTGTTTTEPSFLGGRRFNSFNPSLVYAYAPVEKLSVFAEVFAQTKTATDLGGNYNVDCGFLYLLTRNVVLDVEAGQQFSHQVGSFNYFVGSGISLKL